MSEIDYHNETIGRILAHLIKRGLARTDLKPSDAVKFMGEQRGSDEQMWSEFADCVEWMHAEGIIRWQNDYKTYSHGTTFFGVQLTSRGVALVKRDTNDADIGTSIEERVTKAKEGELSARDYSKFGDFVGGVLGGFTKAMSG